MLFMGIDVGTQGVRCLVCDDAGRAAASKSVAFRRLNVAGTQGWQEQDPADWQAAAEEAISACAAQLRDAGRLAELTALSIDGTSGTIVPLDADHRPLYNGIMYNDPRADAEAAEAQAALSGQAARLGYRIGASYALPRLLWIKRHRPDIYEKTAVFAHQADYIAGLLCGEYAVSDYSNALKTGYDLENLCWPDAIGQQLGIDMNKLPRIVSPGAPIVPLTQAAADRLGLLPGATVCGGSTDGYASALAAGAVRPGSWASILGTTFVLKGVTRQRVQDPDGACYSHLLPGGAWLLGGAANIGGRALNACAAGQSFTQLDAESELMVPTGVRCYPLPGRGERFPFVKPDCEPFYVGDVTGGRLYPAVMEGVGFAERLAYDRVMKLGCPVSDVIHTTGGACRSPLWLKIRASILGRQLKVPRAVDAAMGSALLAASGQLGGKDGLPAAAEHMIEYVRTVDPDPALAAAYGDIYGRFLEDIRKFYGVEV